LGDSKIIRGCASNGGIAGKQKEAAAGKPEAYRRVLLQELKQRLNLQSTIFVYAPKGLRPPAQGCRFGYPWGTKSKRIQPQRGCEISY